MLLLMRCILLFFRYITPLLGTGSIEDAIHGLILRPPAAAAYIVLAGAVRGGSTEQRWNGAFLNGMAQSVPDLLLPSMATDDAVAKALWDVAERVVTDWEQRQ